MCQMLLMVISSAGRTPKESSGARCRIFRSYVPADSHYAVQRCRGSVFTALCAACDLGGRGVVLAGRLATWLAGQLLAASK